MKRATTSLFLVLFVAGILTLPSCSSVTSVDGYRFDRKGKTATGHAEGEISLETASVQVENQFGTVRVGVAEGPPKWSWDLTCWANTAESADRFREEIVLQMDEAEDQHSWTLILPEPPMPELRGVESNLTLLVPPSVHVDVTNGFGDTEIRGVQGGTTARCRHGQLQLVDLAGDIDAETSFANIQLKEVGGNVRLRNKHGNITGRQLQGSIDAEDEHGNIDLHTGSPEVDCENEHGNILLVLTNPDLRLVRAETSFGSLRLNVPASLRPKIEARTTHGTITSGLPVLAKGTGIDDLDDLDPDVPRITLKSKHGDIEIKTSSATTGRGFTR